MRARGELLYLSLGGLLYPGYQFDVTNTRVQGAVSPPLKLATDLNWDPEDVALWLCSPTRFLPDGTRPVDHLQDQKLVLTIAARAWGVEW